MRVQVKLFASLRNRVQGEKGKAEIELKDGASLQDLIDHLNISNELAQLVMINGEQLPLDGNVRSEKELQEGDTISIFPPIAGG
ncbi:MAG: MoaD/ThiS family protein [Dehalococcoidia bacterium]